MEQFAVILEKWYESHGRDLPWRATADPYRIWVSEIILQQTRVAQGYEYFMRFMERFPTVQALAGAADAMLMRWALMPSIANGLSTTHYYYPGTNTWRNAQGTTVDPPSNIKVGTPSSSKTKGSVFGSTGRTRSTNA